MSTTPVLNGQIIGQTEHATRALLESLLAKTGTTFHQSVALNQTAAAGGTITLEALTSAMVHGLKIDAATAIATVASLADAGLVTGGDTVAFTEAGRDRQAGIRAGITEVTARLYGDLPQSDLEIAARVLITITDRANAQLAAASTPLARPLHSAPTARNALAPP
jgi:hypothetical protein